MSIALAGICLNAMAMPMIPAGIPIVTVQATQPLATEPGNNPAVFTFSRAYVTTNALTVTFGLGGTASNGVDYVAVSNSVTLAAGQISTNVVITPIAEPSATGYKTVVLTLPSPHFGRTTPEFLVGSLNRAVAYIAYNYTNVPPTVSLVAPTNGASFLSLPNINIAANASDSNGWVTAVEFLANNKSLGVVSNSSCGSFPVMPFARYSQGSSLPIFQGSQTSRYQFVWTNVPAGNYSLTAIATDNAGLQTTSAAIDIVVTTNLPTPAVRIVSPAAGAQFPDMAPINIYAAATEVGGVVKTVEFLGNSNSLGIVTNYLAAEPSSQFYTQWLPFSFQWTNAPIGSNILTAIATDNNGIQATSAPVGINVSSNAYHHHRGW